MKATPNTAGSTPAISTTPGSTQRVKPATTVPVVTGHHWPTNAELIADVARLGLIKADDRTVDVTYGNGIWWKQFRPDSLTKHDLKLDGVDFTRLPEANNSYDVVAYDPPYVAMGGRQTTTVPDFADRYGLLKAPSSPQALQTLIDCGLAEAYRVLKPGGRLLVKCQDYVSGGRTWPGDFRTHAAAEALGFRYVTKFHHVRAGVGPQPSGRRQWHPRANTSVLMVFQVPGGRR